MKHTLSVIEKGSITGVEELQLKQYFAFKTYLKILTDFQQDQQLYTIVNMNYDEIYSTFGKYFNIYKEKKGSSQKYMEESFTDINRCMLNYLSSFRTYLDHTETLLKIKYGNNSGPVKK